MRLADDPCDHAVGAVKAACESEQNGDGGGAAVDPGGPPESLDPLQQFAHETAKAAAWTANQLGKLVADRETIDLTNTAFLRQYAIVFAASTILVLVVWLLAVAKRAVRGVPFTQAFGEAIGLLWLAVGATAFTPLILYTVIGATDAVTDAIVAGTGSKPGGLFNSLGEALKEDKIGGGPLILAVTSMATIALCGALWLLLVLRALGLYVGAVLGTVVYAGLVDRDLWGHVRRWAGVMIALILMEPIIVVVLGLAAVLQSDGDVVTGLGVTVVALGVAIYVIMKAPGAGDAIRVARATARGADKAAGVVMGAGGATAGVLHGIHTHGGRSGESAPSSTSTTKGSGGGTSGGVSSGMAAHGGRGEGSSRRRGGDAQPKNSPPKKSDET
ncbi:hypothetical protein [Streptomyces spirodelae]|uniref:Integral membrane protein n=1 Tax=Streptomyces spirodelae TaxID=2812904 RepID=A0ABS3X1I7_9ACTN|nr:hypothetical protein [Streptomyces spirodelae]MBO8189189.1 hypothetical protein [Streptomyces spirodelae]